MVRFAEGANCDWFALDVTGLETQITRAGADPNGVLYAHKAREQLHSGWELADVAGLQEKALLAGGDSASTGCAPSGAGALRAEKAPSGAPELPSPIFGHVWEGVADIDRVVALNGLLVFSGLERRLRQWAEVLEKRAAGGVEFS